MKSIQGIFRVDLSVNPKNIDNEYGFPETKPEMNRESHY